MIMFNDALAAVDASEIKALDTSMFSHGDIVNIILQRSEVLQDIARPGRVIREWSAGNTARLDEQIKTRGDVLVRRAAAYIWLEFEELRPTLDTIAPKRSADIGCGYAIFDLFLAKTYGSHVSLIDIEANEHRHFGFKKEAAAYTDLGRARDFLTANGVASDRVHLCNPNRDQLDDISELDLVTSFVSCGFHYPANAYEAFFKRAIRPGGAVILDLRKRTYDNQIGLFESLGQTITLGEASDGAALRVLTRTTG